MASLTLALIQQAFDKTVEQTICNSERMIAEATQKEAKLVVLQELHTLPYFCQSEDHSYFEYAKNYEQLKSIFSNIAKNYQVVLVTSLFEMRAKGIYHNSAVIFDSDGREAGVYRKMHIPDDPNFYEKFYFTPGDLGFKPIATSVGHLGVMICWDQWFPEAARVMALNGADILIYPTAIGWSDEVTKAQKTRSKKAWINVQRGHAIANHLPILTTNRVGFEKNPTPISPADKTALSEGIEFWGNSFVLNAYGEIVAKAKQQEEVLMAQIDFDLTTTLRQVFPFLRDRRPEYYEDIGHLFKKSP